MKYYYLYIKSKKDLSEKVKSGKKVYLCKNIDVVYGNSIYTIDDIVTENINDAFLFKKKEIGVNFISSTIEEKFNSLQYEYKKNNITENNYNYGIEYCFSLFSFFRLFKIGTAVIEEIDGDERIDLSNFVHSIKNDEFRNKLEKLKMTDLVDKLKNEIGFLL